MEKINWIELDKKEHFAAWLILHAMSDSKAHQEMMHSKDFDATKLNIEVKINGKEVSILKVAERMEEVFQREVEIKSKEIINETVGLTMDNLDVLKNTIIREYERLKPKMVKPSKCKHQRTINQGIYIDLECSLNGLPCDPGGYKECNEQ
jgi:hypothetical protein